MIDDLDINNAHVKLVGNPKTRSKRVNFLIYYMNELQRKKNGSKKETISENMSSEYKEDEVKPSTLKSRILNYFENNPQDYLFRNFK